MSEIFYLRGMDPPISAEDVRQMASGAGGCLNLYRTEWRRSFLAADGARMLCWYRAPDAESARMALRQLGSDMSAIWTGEVTSIGTSTLNLDSINRILESTSDHRDVEPARLEQLRLSLAAEPGDDSPLLAIEAPSAAIYLLQSTRSVTEIENCFNEAGVPVSTGWQCTPLNPAGAAITPR